MGKENVAQTGREFNGKVDGETATNPELFRKLSGGELRAFLFDRATELFRAGCSRAEVEDRVSMWNIEKSDVRNGKWFVPDGEVKKIVDRAEKRCSRSLGRLGTGNDPERSIRAFRFAGGRSPARVSGW